MDNNSSGPLIFLGILGILGIAVLLTRRESSPPVAVATGWEKVDQAVPPQVVYQNKEEWEIVRGSDRLIEKIVIHREVTQNG